MARGDRVQVERRIAGTAVSYMHLGVDLGGGRVVHARPDDVRDPFGGGRVERTTLAEFAAGGEGLVQSAEERRLDQAAWMMIAFGPGVRKKDGGGRNGAVREHVLDQIGVFDP